MRSLSKECVSRAYTNSLILEYLRIYNRAFVPLASFPIHTEVARLSSLWDRHDSKLNKHFKLTKMLSNTSRTGIVLLGHLAHDPSAKFVVKVQKNKKLGSVDSLDPDVVNGYIMNWVAAQSPHFMITYGAFTCDIAYKKNNASELAYFSACRRGASENKNAVIGYDKLHVVQEYVPGDTLFRFIHTCTERTLIDLIGQILMALVQANRVLGSYQHNDLHTGNVMVRKGPLGKFIRYQVSGMTYYIPSDNVAVIIDYGRSTSGLAATTSAHAFVEKMFGPIELDDQVSSFTGDWYNMFREVKNAIRHHNRHSLANVVRFMDTLRPSLSTWDVLQAYMRHYPRSAPDTTSDVVMEVTIT